MKKAVWTIYKHTTPSNKVYIGLTKLSVNQRWEKGEGYKTCSYFYKAIKKYGWDNIKHDILETVSTFEQAKEREKYYIALYHSNDKEQGYNLTAGGEGLSGYVCSEETKKKISNSHKKIVHWNEGKHLTEEHKQKIREGNKGKIVSAETRKKLHDINFGRKATPEQIEKNRQGHIGIKHTDEWKKKMSEMFKGRKPSKETTDAHTKKYSKAVVQIDNDGNIVKQFSSVANASRELKTSTGAICNVIHGKQKTAGGYKWAYAEGR